MLLRKIEGHLKLSGMAATRFGREAMGDPGLVFQLPGGREPRPETESRILRFIEVREGISGE
jgi:hypothetical protein